MSELADKVMQAMEAAGADEADEAAMEAAVSAVLKDVPKGTEITAGQGANCKSCGCSAFVLGFFPPLVCWRTGCGHHLFNHHIR